MHRSHLNLGDLMLAIALIALGLAVMRFSPVGGAILTVWMLLAADHAIRVNRALDALAPRGRPRRVEVWAEGACIALVMLFLLGFVSVLLVLPMAIVAEVLHSSRIGMMVILNVTALIWLGVMIWLVVAMRRHFVKFPPHRDSDTMPLLMGPPNADGIHWLDEVPSNAADSTVEPIPLGELWIDAVHDATSAATGAGADDAGRGGLRSADNAHADAHTRNARNERRWPSARGRPAHAEPPLLPRPAAGP